MTNLAPHTALHRPATRSRRADALLRALVLAVAASIAALALAGLPWAPASPDRMRVALVIDAGARPQAALGRARAWAARTRRDGVAVSVRVPRTAAEAATDVRYFAAQGYATVVVAGPSARAGAARARGDFVRTRFVSRPGVAGR
jgi:hypothetical protein